MFTKQALPSRSHLSLLAFGLALTAACGALPQSSTEPSDPNIETECVAVTDCEPGMTCEAGQCVDAPDPICTSDADCTAGLHCSAGRCVAMVEPRPQPAPKPTPEVCAKGELSLAARPATVTVLVDQSLSMEQSFDGGSRWTVLKDALLNEQTGAIKTLENDVRFGIALYSSQNGFGRRQDRVCPLLTGLDEVPNALGNFTKIRDVYAAAEPVDDTPTAESLAAVTDKLVALPADGPKVIVLATDGEPDTCDDPDAHGADTNRFAVETARASFAAGVRTYVLSVGTEIAESHLQDMANAGAGVPAGGTNARFFKATDQAGLKNALQSILNDTRSCSFHLDGTLDTRIVEKGTVLLDGQPLVHGTDYSIDANGELVLSAARCNTVKTGNHRVSAEFPCVIDGIPVVK